jgi:hypothetical protein
MSVLEVQLMAASMSILEVQLMSTSRHLCRVTDMLDVGAGSVNVIAAIQRIGFIGQESQATASTTLVLGSWRQNAYQRIVRETLQTNSANGTQLDFLVEGQLLVEHRVSGATLVQRARTAPIHKGRQIER